MPFAGLRLLNSRISWQAKVGFSNYLLYISHIYLCVDLVCGFGLAVAVRVVDPLIARFRIFELGGAR